MNRSDFDKVFLGREDILEILKKRISGLKDGYRQNVALLGNPNIGKTTLLKHFLHNLDDQKVSSIHLDLGNKDFTYFLNKFVGSLLYSYCKNHGLPIHNQIPVLMESAKLKIPYTLSVIKKIYQDFEKGKFAECYLGLLNLPEVFTNETGTFAVLVFDEFQNIEEFQIPEVFQNLGKKIMTQKRCLYILSSSYEALAKKIIGEKLSLLFGNFEVIPVEAFDAKSSQQCIERNLGEVKIGAQLRNFIIDFAGGHPLYLNLISQETHNLAAIYRQTEIYMPIIVQAIENTIFDRWGVISRHFELIVNEISSAKVNAMTVPVLLSMAAGKNKLEDIVSDLNVKKSLVAQRLARLIELGIVVKNGNFHYFKDKLFKYWIKYVYQRRLKAVDFSSESQQKEFKDEINSCIEEFKLTSRKDFSSRIVDLLSCFDNESFQLNGRKYKIPPFRTIEPVKLSFGYSNAYDLIKATTESGVWVVVLKKESFGEQEVNSIVAESKKMGGKPERCMIISLTDLDENAKLRALQEKFWVWCEGELNTVLTLFDKPSISR